MKVVIWKRKNAHRRYTKPLRDFLSKRGHKPELVVDRKPPTCDALIIWNGNNAREKALAGQFRSAGVPVFYMEVGYLSQKSHYIISKNGSVGGDLLRGEPVPELTDADELYLQNEFQRYAPGIDIGQPGNQISGFFQLPKDYAITNHSPFHTMQDVINEADRRWPDEKVVWKVHPLQRRLNVKTRFPNYRGSTIWPHVANAKLCIAANSTALFECALAGRPVQALGQSPLQRKEGSRAVVREVLRRQIPIDSIDIEQPLERSIGKVF